MINVPFKMILGKLPTLEGTAQYNAETGQVLIPEETEQTIAENWANPLTEAVIVVDGKVLMIIPSEGGWFTMDALDETDWVAETN